MSDVPAAALTPTELVRATGMSMPYASQILADKRTPSRAMAITIFRKLGVKLGPIKGATDDEIEVLERFEGSDGKAA